MFYKNTSNFNGEKEKKIALNFEAEMKNQISFLFMT